VNAVALKEFKATLRAWAAARCPGTTIWSSGLSSWRLEAERAPIAVKVLGLSTEKWTGKLERSSIKRGKDEQQLTLTYHGGPLAPVEADRTSSVQVGDRAPDAVLTDTDDAGLRSFEALRGPHFTAIGYGSAAAQDLARLSWPAMGAELKRITVGPDGYSDAPGRWSVPTAGPVTHYC